MSARTDGVVSAVPDRVLRPGPGGAPRATRADRFPGAGPARATHRREPGCPGGVA